jgi:hypothetical protein
MVSRPSSLPWRARGRRRRLRLLNHPRRWRSDDAESGAGCGLWHTLTIRDEVVDRGLPVRVRLQRDHRCARHARLRGATEDARVTLVHRDEDRGRPILAILSPRERKDRRVVLILQVCVLLLLSLARIVVIVSGCGWEIGRTGRHATLRSAHCTLHS